MKMLSVLRQITALAVLGAAGWAQSVDTAQDEAVITPPAASAQDTGTLRISPNPPVSGLDEPALEPALTPRSFFQPGLHVSQSLDSNAFGAAAANVQGISRLLGSASLQRVWKRYDVAGDYIGGIGLYGRNASVKQIHALTASETALWRTGQASLREIFSYLPEGSFGFGSYGGVGGFSLSGYGLGGSALFGGGSNFLGSGQLASLGQVPRITSLVSANVNQYLSPRTAVTVVGSYALVHFTGNPVGYIDSRQASGQLGVSHVLGPKDQVGASYGYQHFLFPQAGGGNFDTQVLNLIYGHAITGRLSVVVAGGPQVTIINAGAGNGSTRTVSGSGRISVKYLLKGIDTSATYEHLNTSGSGLFYGATTNVFRASMNRHLGHVWSAFGDMGYSHNARIQQIFILGTNASSFQFGFVGGGVRRPIGRDYNVFASYQFNSFAYDSSFCLGVPNCHTTSFRHIFNFGVDWRPRPIRLD